MMENPQIKDAFDMAAKLGKNEAMMKKIAELKGDPEFKDYFDDMQKGGPAAMMKYFNDKKFLAALGAKMGSLPEGMANVTPQQQAAAMAAAAAADPSTQEAMKV